MNESFDASELTSATMRASAAPSTTLSESEFLKQQADQAQQAMLRTLKLAGKNLGHTIDPRAWTQTHPWLTLSTAAVAGFAAAFVIPKKSKPPVVPVEQKDQPQKDQPADEKPAGGSFWARMFGHAFKFGSKWIASVLFANLASQLKTADSDEENGAAQTEAGRSASVHQV